MHATSVSRTSHRPLSHRALLRIVLAALIGISIVALAAGSENPPADRSPQFDRLSATANVALRGQYQGDYQVDEPLPQYDLQPAGEPVDGYEPPTDNYPRRTPRWYDGLWDDPRFMAFISRIA